MRQPTDDPQYNDGYSDGHGDGYAQALQDTAAAVSSLASTYGLRPDGFTPPQQESVSEQPTEPPAVEEEDVIRVAPEAVDQPDPATDLQKKRNRERADRIGIAGIYRSRLALMPIPIDNPEPVLMVGEDPDGWWFYLPETWPSPSWRGDIRWFAKDGATFTEAPSEPAMAPGDMGDDGDFDDRG